ncbi:MAG: DUF971 domain-containing protein [Rhodobiaceae bacterium]|nr:DUF971 domain-containing protein [Rhodobiaceae bacterium]
MSENEPKPTEIRLSKDKSVLSVTFPDSGPTDFSAEFLRVNSPSAEVQGHSPSQRQTVPGKRNVLITGVAPVGNYAVRLTFSDSHQSGIYSWSYFLSLAAERDRLWNRYLAELEEKGLSRDSAPPQALKF